VTEENGQPAAGQPPADPAEERRGGEFVDWDNARPGEPLPDYGDGLPPDPRF
jgi:hypothetical protein